MAARPSSRGFEKFQTVNTPDGLSASDVRWFSENVLRMYGCLTERELFTASGGAIHVKFSSVVTVVEEVAADFSSFALHSFHGTWTPPPWYATAIADNPIARHVTAVRRDGTFKNSELVSKRDLEDTNAYNLILRPAGLRDVIMAATHIRPDVACGLGVARDMQFGSSESHLLELTRRHFHAAIVRLRRANQARGVESLPDSTIRLSSESHPVSLSASLAALLKNYFPSASAQIAACRLPEDLTRWVISSLEMLATRPPLNPLTYFKAESARGTLLVRLFPAQPDGRALLRLTEVPRQPDPFALRGRGLSTRECEVLHWIGAGKRDAEIAVILQIAPRTVGKHVERILQKLGAENRLSAIRLAQEFH